MKHKFILFFVFAFLFYGCSDASLEIGETRGSLVCEYNDEVSIPNVRLSVFSEVYSDVRRIDYFKIKNLKENFTWDSSSPIIFSASSRKWVGYTNFVIPDNTNFPDGIYFATCIDSQGNKIDGSFNLSYPYDLLKMNCKSAEKLLGKRISNFLLIYNSNNEVVYHGERKRNWRDDESIFKSNNNYAKYRRCITNYDESIVLLMPFIYKQNKEQTTN